MAFTKTPAVSTDQTKIVPLMHEWNTRNITNNYDSDSINVLFEPVKNQLTGDDYFQVLKRDGLAQVPLTPEPPTAIYGSYYWVRPGTTTPLYVVAAAGGTYAYNMFTGTLEWSDTSSGWSDTIIGFTEFLYDDGTVDLIISAGNATAKFTTVGVRANLIYAFTANPYPVFLDGYLFLSEVDTGNIYNSNLNDPTTFSASSIISAESYPDVVLAIARSGQYIVAFGKSSIQFFYDAANPTGTPLAPQTTTLNIGYYGGLASYQGDLYFLGAATNGNISLFKLSGLKAEAIADLSFTRWANTLSSVVSVYPGGGLVGAIMVMNGHAVYTVNNFRSVPSSPDFTYAYDLYSGLWTRLAYQGTTELNFRATAVVYRDLAKGTHSFVSFNGGTTTYEFDSSTYQDAGVNFNVSFTTPNMDFGTYRKKFGSRIMVHADQTPTLSNAFISWSDDDYQTFSTPRTVNMAGQYKQMFRLGSFRKRAFKFTYSDNFPMRWEFLELDYSQGNS